MKDRFSALPDDLLVKILSLVPTTTAAATVVFSKRWRFVLTMLPKLEFKDSFDERERAKRWRRFIIKSIKLYKAPVIETLCIQLRRSNVRPFGAAFRKWIAKAVDRHVRVLEFEVLRSDMLIDMPTSLYTCKTLVELSLSTGVLVDVPSSACLPSLKRLLLVSVVYKDENSLVRLLSGCSVLARSTIRFYIYDHYQYQEGTTSINNVTLTKDVPCVHIICRANYKILSSLPLATSLTLYQKYHVAASFSGITFSRLQRFELLPIADGWSNQLLLFLDESPNLRFLSINSVRGSRPGVLPLSRHQPSSVPRCLSSHVHNFEWKEYRGPEEERELVRYIFANSGCLKKATFTWRDIFNPEGKDKLVNELKSLPRVSQMSQLIHKEVENW